MSVCIYIYEHVCGCEGLQLLRRGRPALLINFYVEFSSISALKDFWYVMQFKCFHISISIVIF